MGQYQTPNILELSSHEKQTFILFFLLQG